MRYQAKFNKQENEWDVIDTISSEIVAMLGCKKEGESDAKRIAHNYNVVEQFIRDTGLVRKDNHEN